jgi:hypothetical protein
VRTVRLGKIPEHDATEGRVRRLERGRNCRERRGVDVARSGGCRRRGRAEVDLHVLVWARGLGPGVPERVVPVIRVPVVVHAAVVVVCRGWSPEVLSRMGQLLTELDVEGIESDGVDDRAEVGVREGALSSKKSELIIRRSRCQKLTCGAEG